MTPQNDNKKTFFDPATLVAFALILAFWYGWSYWLEKKYPTPPPGTSAQETPKQEGAKEPEAFKPSAGPAPEQAVAAAPVAPQGRPEELVSFDDQNMAFQVSSKGMGLKTINIKAFQTRDNKPIILGNVETNLPFSTYLAGSQEPIDFTIEKLADGVTFVGRANVEGVNIEKSIKVNSATYAIDSTVVTTGSGGFKGLVTVVADVLEASQGGSFLAPSYDHQDFFLNHDGGTTERQVIAKEKGLQMQGKNVGVLALSSHYFTMAVLDRSDLLPRFETNVPVNSPAAVGRLVYEPAGKTDGFQIKYTGFAGPKKYSLLAEIDPRLASIVDYGTFWFIAKPLLWLMKFFHSIFHNWGVAIIFLTLVVRLLVMPFALYSFRSMKVMQRIQPQMKALQEKYKDDKQRLNQEIMMLMRQNKANPLGGCLPLLLQFPVFIALYQVLGQSIELYRAPFMLWIQDLSLKDPFYVLPVLMGITLFVQQKMTPTAMDPAQAKVLMWMPVLFSFFMLSLPSGLTLYIFVSTLFGIVQQYLFMREKAPKSSVTQVRA